MPKTQQDQMMSSWPWPNSVVAAASICGHKKHDQNRARKLFLTGYETLLCGSKGNNSGKQISGSHHLDQTAGFDT